ncbi:MAG TPA: hypothetical protein PK014_11360 [Thermoanaerobaculia bacterium]|nr:hypothetical protein [Thermoanaerobaculia bacterium]HUM30746.1 hypothetical protein [Thermoanaerobaculia bacterium]HXK68965.1 hypothetical protein [Thermoanaerobaculia bacterium]
MKFLLILFLIFSSGGLLAFHSSTEEALLQRAAQWGPRDAQILFKDYSREFWQGVQNGRRGPRPTEHEILMITDSIIEGFNTHRSMPEIMESWGRLSGRLLQLCDPAVNGSIDLSRKRISSDFDELVRWKQKKIPVIFYGFSPSFFKGDRLGYLHDLSRNQKEWMDLLWFDYRRLGQGESYRSFDDRGNAFGVVSLSLNRTFTTLLHFWYYIWQQAGGRMGPLRLSMTPDSILVVDHGY